MEKGQRPPVVTVLGHVDHGKTTLLDAIRKSNVATKEAGGITQSIGASVVTTKEGKKIVFIDTPGHAAFSKMRSRGASVADIALLVVASEDGVKPQTLEALDHIRQANIPFIVVFTKIDLSSASIETAQGQLEKEGILFEKRGGQTPWVGVSAKESKGIIELLELISLVSEVNDIKGDAKSFLEAVVIETSKNMRGPLATAVVRNGTLKVGQEIMVEHIFLKVRGLFDWQGKAIKEALPSDPVLILGFSELPSVGATIKDKKDAVPFSKDKEVKKETKVSKGQIPVFIKAQNAGALEAILSQIPPQIVTLAASVGEVTESDVLDAKGNGVTYIFAFESKIPSHVSKLADAEGVKIESFKIIYELFDKMAELVKKGEIEIFGKAEVVASFPFNNRKIAGCKVISGRIQKGDNLVLLRGERELGKIKIISMKKQKQDISEAKAGEEFGILFEPQVDFIRGDMVVSLEK